MLSTLIRRELLDNLMTFRFAAALFIMLLLVVANTAVLIKDYERRLADYNTAVKKHQQEAAGKRYLFARVRWSGASSPTQSVEHLQRRVGQTVGKRNWDSP